MDVIVGGGKYGVEAARFLEKRSRDYVIIDRNPECLAMRELDLVRVDSIEEVKEGRYFLKGGIEILPSLLKFKPEYIFPTAPLHVAAEALRLKFDLKPWNEVLDCIIGNLPARVVVSAGRGSVVVSYNRDADCLEKCSAPDICPVTKIKKPCPMHELVKFAYPDAFVLISRQLEPGLGAIEGKEFAELMKQAEKREKIVVATACRCHGVITALKRA
ncbi:MULTISPECIES: hypothetical protein [Archaeoglobus]|uniref:Pyridine nucleotide-disulfide oxidoreductase n=1 Tax=Archaeoglobus fulgidus DSM 8774 TaxID=1344584 RepID=A0A075WKW1_ARCFL|nr:MULTISPECIES: hypothetical protein [Archaeoglobus]AIG98193.1 Pyridine nucleotide-disulfide oxidoreductase [Archaeoglobus fulgidus DSM 8774]MDI3498080.1 hypothetical protein [Archaeoglobus sp.]